MSRVPIPRLTGPKGDIAVDRVEILYEDQALIAVNKPARLPMHANLDPNRGHLVGVLSRQLQERDGEAGYLGVHQRLDWGTSGVVVFTRCREVNANIAEQFERHSLSKVYLALAGGERWPQRENWRVAVPLGAPLRKGGQVQIGGSTAVAACTNFRLLRRQGKYGLIEARLETGRKHQIRAHLLSEGLHLCGDDLYGGALHCSGRQVERPMLHARSLSLVHPVSGCPLTLVAPVPADFAALAEKLGLSAALPDKRR